MKHCIICGANRCTCGAHALDGSPGFAPTIYAPLGSFAAKRRAESFMFPPFLVPFEADRNIYLNESGEVVEENDDSRCTLLINKGGLLSGADAVKYGLVETTLPEGFVETTSPNLSKVETRDGKADKVPTS